MAGKREDQAPEGYISKAVLRNTRVSPQKARLVADLVRGQQVEVALDILTGCDKKTAPVMRKLILSAVSNAAQSDSSRIDSLFVKRIWVDHSRTLKRSMPRAQGRATPIRKRFSSITVMLDERV